MQAEQQKNKKLRVNSSISGVSMRERSVNRIEETKNDFNDILEAIKRATVKIKKDKFTKKFGMIVCNQTYDKAGLPDLPQTKNDFKEIKRMTRRMNIKQENLFELINAGFDEMNIQFDKLCDEIQPYVMKLSNRTGIGSG